jgi:hypothetical protein
MQEQIVFDSELERVSETLQAVQTRLLMSRRSATGQSTCLACHHRCTKTGLQDQQLLGQRSGQTERSGRALWSLSVAPWTGSAGPAGTVLESVMQCVDVGMEDDGWDLIGVKSSRANESAKDSILFLFSFRSPSQPAHRVAHVRCLCAAMRGLKRRDVTPKTFRASSTGRLPTAEAKQ